LEGVDRNSSLGTTGALGNTCPLGVVRPRGRAELTATLDTGVGAYEPAGAEGVEGCAFA